MSLEICFTADARDELQEAILYYQGEAPGLGADLLAEVEIILSLIGEHPELGSPYESGTRRLLLRHFPYSIVYLVAEEQVTIVAIAHQRRRPGYWRERL